MGYTHRPFYYLRTPGNRFDVIFEVCGVSVLVIEQILRQFIVRESPFKTLLGRMATGLDERLLA